MAKDNVHDDKRAVFEQVFLETQSALMRRLEKEGLPNEVLETMLGRLIAYRAAVTKEPTILVVDRVAAVAVGYEREARTAIALARMILGEP